MTTTSPPRTRRFGRRALWIAVIVVLLLIIGTAVAMASAGRSAADRYRTVAVSRDTVDVTVQSVGTISPVNQADLRFPTTGTVTGVSVEVGQHVTPGQELGTIDPTALQTQLAQAQSTEATARSRLATDESGGGGTKALPSSLQSGAAQQAAAQQAAAQQAAAQQAAAAQAAARAPAQQAPAQQAPAQQAPAQQAPAQQVPAQQVPAQQAAAQQVPGQQAPAQQVPAQQAPAQQAPAQAAGQPGVPAQVVLPAGVPSL